MHGFLTNYSHSKNLETCCCLLVHVRRISLLGSSSNKGPVAETVPAYAAEARAILEPRAFVAAS